MAAFGATATIVAEGAYDWIEPTHCVRGSSHRRQAQQWGLAGMRMQFFGDSHDIVKLCLLQSLASSAQWYAFPMFTHAVSYDELAAFEAFLGVSVVSPDVPTANIVRSEHLAVQVHHRHVLVDPDTGIKLKPCEAVAGTKYVFGPELIELCRSDPERLVLVSDQSVPRRSERDSIVEKLAFFEDQTIYGFAYLSHACFVVLSTSEQVSAAAHDRLLASNLPAARIRQGALYLERRSFSLAALVA